MKLSKNDLIFISALLLAIWFALMGMVWVYGAAIVIAYPAGIISWLLYNKGLKSDKKVQRYKIIKIILITGLVLSLATLTYLLLFE